MHSISCFFQVEIENLAKVYPALAFVVISTWKGLAVVNIVNEFYDGVQVISRIRNTFYKVFLEWHHVNIDIVARDHRQSSLLILTLSRIIM